MNTTEKMGLILFVVSMFAIYDKGRTGMDAIIPVIVLVMGLIMFLL